MSLTGLYLDKFGRISEYTTDQTVIIKKHFIGDRSDIFRDPIYYLPDQSEEPEAIYPLVNSYYPFTEDVDAYARVHHLLESNTSLPTLDQRCVTFQADYYSEKETQAHYLESKPTCFLIVGKPGLGELELGRRLAEHWKCVYIEPQILIEEAIQSGSRIGQCIEFNLRCGRAIGVDVIYGLLQRRTEAPVCQHRGFVLCGFPLIPNDLYEEDPLSSESAIFSVKEIFEEIFEHAFDIVEGTPTKVSLTSSIRDDLSLKDKPLEQPKVQSYAESSPGEKKSDDPEKIQLEDPGTPGLLSARKEAPVDLATDLQKQLNEIFALFSRPFFIVYIFCGNADVVSSRDHYFYDFNSRRTLDMRKINLFLEIGAQNEDLTRDLFEFGSNPFADNPALKHLVRVPENFPSHVRTQLDRYHQTIGNHLDSKILLHDQQYFIRVDGRAMISRSMDLVKRRLNILPLQRVLIPQKLTILFEAAGGEDEPATPSPTYQETPEEAFVKLSKHQIAAPPFKWTWSDWGVLCPVSMRNGVYKRGNPQFAVQFLNKLFFLADEDCFVKFRENPRYYLMAPYPKPGKRKFIFGPPCCGKSDVAKCLSLMFDSKILTMSAMLSEFIERKTSEYLQKVRQAAITEGIQLREQQLQEEYKTNVKAREERTIEWIADCRTILEELNTYLQRKESDTALTEISSFPIKVVSMFDWDGEDPIIHRISVEMSRLNLPLADLEECNALLTGDGSALLQFLPETIKAEIVLETVTPHDEFVQSYAESAVKNADLKGVEEECEQLAYEMFVDAVKTIEEQGHGWIIDGMTTDLHLLTQISYSCPVDEVFILSDDPNCEFLIRQMEQDGHYSLHFHNYRDLFTAMHEKQALARLRADRSTDSFKKRLVGEVLSDILKPSISSESFAEYKRNNMRRYKEALTSYQEAIPAVREFFIRQGQMPIEVSVTDLATEELLKELVNKLSDKYRQTASEFSDIDRSEEVQTHLAQQGRLDGGETEGLKPDDGLFFERNRRYGNTNTYCPVTFANDWVLWRGKEQYAAKFKNKIYLMSDADKLAKFIERPRQYIPCHKPIRRFPPPRICVVGVPQSGRTTLAKQLANNLGVRYFNYAEEQQEAANAFSMTAWDLASFQSEMEHSDHFTMKFLDRFVNKLWFDEPVRSVGFVVDGFPRRTRGLDVMIRHNAIPDAIICISVSDRKCGSPPI